MTCFRRHSAALAGSRDARPLVLALSLFAAACSSKPAPSPSTPPAPPAPSVEIVPGAAVSVSRGGQAVAAHVVRQAGPGRFLVHYDGFGPEWDEVVGADRIGPRPPAPLAHDYHVGEKVIVVVQGRRLAGEIVAPVGADLWRVHYDGYAPEMVENVGPERLARPFTGATPHPPGEPVGIEVSGRVLAAKVLFATAADRWLARFDGFGPQYDVEVTADRFRPTPAAAPAAAAAAPPPSAPPPVTPEPAAKGGKGDKAKDAAKSKGGKAAEPAAPPPAPLGPPQVGDAVFVAQRGGVFAPAKVASVGPGSLRVHYDGPGVSPDEDVPEARVTRAPAPLKGAKYQVNQPVFIEWHGVFVGGKVVKEAGDAVYKIRFDGFGPESDEVVHVKRLRPRS